MLTALCIDTCFAHRHRRTYLHAGDGICTATLVTDMLRRLLGVEHLCQLLMNKGGGALDPALKVAAPGQVSIGTLSLMYAPKTEH